MAEEIQEAVQIIRVAYDGIEIAMKVGSGGIAAMQKAIDFLKGMLDYEKSLGKTSMRKLLLKGGDLQVLQFKTEDMRKVERMAKKYGILYSVLPDCNKTDGMSEVIFHTEAVPRVNMMIQKLKFGRIATFDDYLKNGDEKSLGKLMDFLRKQQGNEKSHTVEGDKVNSAIDGLIEKVGMFAMEKQAISVEQVKENFSINGEQAENVIKQLETIGVLGGRSEDGTHKVINQISKNVNIGNRKKLINGNGFVFGVPGSGKSFFCKMEMGSVFLSGDDEIIVIDPMNEYFDIAQTYGGTVVNMSTYTDNYVNPLEMDVWSLDPNDSKGMIREKGEFMLGLCEQCIGDSLNSRQKSIIDRCVRKMYIDIARGREKYIPVMSDFYDILMEQPEDEAKDIALSLELFVNGSLNIFNHQTNVDVDNRFTVYGIRDLGTELSPITMLVMMESIQNRIVENGQKGKATWLYIDEFHVLLNSEYSAKYLQQLWKKVRKQGGLCTGITQNVVDLLQNYTATTMLANSEFVALLKQANTDSSKMAEVIGVSEAQLRFVTNTASGMGLIKCGSVVIPFDNQISKDTDLYRLYNTNIHEKIAEQKKREAKFAD